MEASICGVDCAECPFQSECGGCAETGGRPFGGDCVVALCCQRTAGRCAACADAPCGLRRQIAGEFNALGIPGLPEVTDLAALRGSFVNMAYPLPNGETVRLLEDEKIYLGTQLPKAGTDRCFGLAADAAHLLVCEYAAEGADPEIVCYKRRPQ